MFHIRLSENDSHIIKEALLTITSSPYKSAEEFEKFLSDAKSIFNKLLPDSLKIAIDHFIISQQGVLEISGLPQDNDLPLTPSKGGTLPEGYKKTLISEACILGISSLLRGEVFNFRQEAFGTAPIIDNIVPLKKMKTQKGAGGYINNFPFHRESAWHRLSPSYLLLKGVRQDHEGIAKTLVTSFIDIIKQLTPAENEILRHPIFRIGAPELYLQMHEKGIPLGTSEEVMVPIISGDIGSNNHLKIMLNMNNMSTDNKEAQKVLKKLEVLLYQNSKAFCLRGDNIVIIDNNTAVHTRNGYSPRFDGYDRWFQRVNVQTCLWKDRKINKNIFHEKNSNISEKLSCEIFDTILTKNLIDPDGYLTNQFYLLEKKYRENILSQGSKESKIIDLKNFQKESQILNILLEHAPIKPFRIV